MEQASLFALFKPGVLVWKTKDLAAGPRLIFSSHMSRIFDLQVLGQCHFSAGEKSFFLPCQAAAENPGDCGKGGQSNQRTTGDGRQVRALNETRSRASVWMKTGERKR